MLKGLRFKSKKGFQKWLAYGHMHGVMKGCGAKKIIIGHHVHKVKHHCKR